MRRSARELNEIFKPIQHAVRENLPRRPKIRPELFGITPEDWAAFEKLGRFMAGRLKPLPDPDSGKDFQDFDQLRLDTFGWRILLEQIESSFCSQASQRAARNYSRILADYVELEPFSVMEPIPQGASSSHGRPFTRSVKKL